MSRTSFTKETTKKIQHVEQYLAATEVGKRLSEIGRWKQFRTEETDEEWLSLLGPTAFVLPHQRHFVRFLQRWISTPEHLLLLGSSVHGIGEAVVGDTPYHLKTAESEAEEFAAAITLIQALDLETTLVQELEDAYRQVVIGENASLNALFSALEKTEHLDTAIEVFSNLQRDMKMVKGPILIFNVLSSDLPKVLDWAEKFPDSVGRYLKYYQSTISDMFDFATSPDSTTTPTPQFIESLERWVAWIER